MIVDVITVFPDMFAGPLNASLLRIAQEKGILHFRPHDLRDWTHDSHRSVDDAPYGGGPGMVMKPEPLFEAIEAVQEIPGPRGTVVIFAPAGTPFTQAIAREMALHERLILVCGRYEGIDERVFSLADMTLSIGDYVLTGGELPAMVVIDAVTRLLPGVLGDDGSSVEESFTGGLLEYPHYTRPASYRGLDVPEVLRSGDHARIAAWRRAAALERTAARRPDLLEHASLTEAERRRYADILDPDSDTRPGGPHD